MTDLEFYDTSEDNLESLIEDRTYKYGDNHLAIASATPFDRVFIGILQLAKYCKENVKDEAVRNQILRSISNIHSWEQCLMDRPEK